MTDTIREGPLTPAALPTITSREQIATRYAPLIDEACRELYNASGAFTTTQNDRDDRFNPDPHLPAFPQFVLIEHEDPERRITWPHTEPDEDGGTYFNTHGYRRGTLVHIHRLDYRQAREDLVLDTEGSPVALLHLLEQLRACTTYLKERGAARIAKRQELIEAERIAESARVQEMIVREHDALVQLEGELGYQSLAGEEDVPPFWDDRDDVPF